MLKKEKDILHEPLQRFLKGSAIESVRQLGENLSNFHGNRKDADYDMTCTMTAKDAEDAVENAEQIFKSLSEINIDDIGKAVDAYINLTHK